MSAAKFKNGHRTCGTHGSHHQVEKLYAKTNHSESNSGGGAYLTGGAATGTLPRVRPKWDQAPRKGGPAQPLMLRPSRAVGGGQQVESLQDGRSWGGGGYGPAWLLTAPRLLWQ